MVKGTCTEWLEEHSRRTEEAPYSGACRIKSDLSDGLKIGFFRVKVGTILLCGSTAWTLTQSLDKKLDGANTKLLIVVKNVTWQQHITNEVINTGLPGISTTITERCLRFSGHCWRSTNEVVSDLVLCEPKHDKRSIGRQARTFVDLLEVDTWVPRDSLLAAMDDRDGWRKRAMGGGGGRGESGEGGGDQGQPSVVVLLLCLFMLLLCFPAETLGSHCPGKNFVCALA